MKKVEVCPECLLVRVNGKPVYERRRIKKLIRISLKSPDSISIKEEMCNKCIAFKSELATC